MPRDFIDSRLVIGNEICAEVAPKSFRNNATASPVKDSLVIRRPSVSFGSTALTSVMWLASTPAYL